MCEEKCNCEISFNEMQKKIQAAYAEGYAQGRFDQVADDMNVPDTRQLDMDRLRELSGFNGQTLITLTNLPDAKTETYADILECCQDIDMLIRKEFHREQEYQERQIKLDYEKEKAD